MPPYLFKPFPERETERLFLRKLRGEDAQEIFVLRSDEQVLKYLLRKPAASVEDAKSFIHKIHAFARTGTSILWGIALKSKPGKLIGTICLWNMDPENFRAEIGYALIPEFWNKKIIQEAIPVVLDFGFQELGLHSICAKITAGNNASIAVLEKTGFQKEAHFREDSFFNGTFEDTLVYSLLRDEHYSLHIREALTKDIRQIQEVRNSVSENKLSDPGLVPDSDVLDYLECRGQGWVCEKRGDIIGFSIVSLVDNNVWALFIRPGFEKQGIGRKLHDKMLDWYFLHTKESIWLGTEPGTRAENFYRKAGWTETGIHGKGEIKFEMTFTDWKNRK